MFKTAFFSLCFSLASIFFACLVSFKTVPVFAADAYSERILEPAVVLSVQNDPALSEVSGVATSHFNRGYIWAINDSGNEPSLHLVSESGANRIEVNLDHLANYDWEDLDSFVVEGQPYLLIADVGDNLQRRKVYYLHLMPEPRLSPSQPTQHHTASNQIKTIGFQYEDGARDCEAVAVDVANKKIYLLSKRDRPARLYSLPLNMEPSEHLYKAKLVSLLPKLSHQPLIRSGSFLQKLYPNVPTAMSLREQEIAILTYRSLHLYEFKQSPKFNLRKLDTFQLPAMPQAEAMSFLSDGRLVVYSEKVGSPVVMFRRSQPVTLNTKPLYSRIQQ